MHKHHGAEKSSRVRFASTLRRSLLGVHFGLDGSDQLGPTTLGEQIDYSAGPIDTSLTRTQAGLWLQDRVPLGSRITLDPRVRLDWNSFTGEAAWQPRLRATVRAGKATLWAPHVRRYLSTSRRPADRQRGARETSVETVMPRLVADRTNAIKQSIGLSCPPRRQTP